MHLQTQVALMLHQKSQFGIPQAVMGFFPTALDKIPGGVRGLQTSGIDAGARLVRKNSLGLGFPDAGGQELREIPWPTTAARRSRGSYGP